MIEAMKLLYLQRSVFNIQKCYTSSQNVKEKCEVGQYVFVKLSDTWKYVCKLYPKNNLDSDFVYFDCSVLQFCGELNESHTNQLPTVNYWPDSTADEIGELEFIDGRAAVKSLNITVIFDSVKYLKKWKENVAALVILIKSMLRLYIFTPRCFIYFNNLEQKQRGGIYCVFVKDMGEWNNNFCGIVNSGTKVTISSFFSKIKFEHIRNINSIPAVGGLSDACAKLTEIVMYSEEFKRNPSTGTKLRQSQQVLLAGPSGCGKTSLVKHVCACTGALMVTANTMSIFDIAVPSFKQVFEEATELTYEGVCVLLLEDIDLLFGSSQEQSQKNNSARKAAADLALLLERADRVPGLVVVATVVSPRDLDPALRRPGRLASEIHLTVPSESERNEILQVLLQQLATQLTKEELESLCTEVAKFTPGYVGADLALLCQNAVVQCWNYQKNIASDLDKTVWTVAQWKAKLHIAACKVWPSCASANQVTASNKVHGGLSTVGGLSEVKQVLRSAVQLPLLRPDAFSRLGLPQPKGLLLYGPPGCAKTSIVRALASEMQVTFMCTSAAELYSPYVGEAEKNVCELFQRARLAAPTLLFVDEIDALVGSRQGRERGVQERVLSAFLLEMDGIGGPQDIQGSQAKGASVIVIAATNRPELLDDALLRPGRLDRLVLVPAPNETARLEILRVHTKHMPLAPCVDLAAVSAVTELYSGADLAVLCKEAALCALTHEGMEVTCVKHSHFSNALSSTRPSLSREQVYWYDNYGK